MNRRQTRRNAGLPRQWARTGMAALLLLCLCATPAFAAAPDWLEPRGLSVAELVGQVPERYLQGTIISYGDGAGIVVYNSGTRVGNDVVITTTLYPRFSAPSWASGHMLTSFGCLGQRPYYDHMGSVVPPSRLRVYDDSGREVTSEILVMYLTNMDRESPSAGSLSWYRYGPDDDYGPYKTYPLPLGPDGLAIPANSGCRIELPGADYRRLTGVFTLTLDPSARVTFMGSQSASSRSYIGVGDVGIMEPLMRQMRDRYPDRDGRIPLSIPNGADYFLLKFPPMPADPYTDRANGSPNYNADRLSGGTYRLVHGGLSADLCFSAAFPLGAVWQDADQAPGSEFLPMLGYPVALATPEYVIPAGVPYCECFTSPDGCSAAILEQIYETEMSLELIYLAVENPAGGGSRTPLRMAGPAWSPGALAAELAGADTSGAGDPSSATEMPGAAPYRVWLPSVIKSPSDSEPAAGCSCGWFDQWGRMLDCISEP